MGIILICHSFVSVVSLFRDLVDFLDKETLDFKTFVFTV